ncbi:MFS transporter [Haematomicrobium sanguinis]|uniref:MFS transporter n=1 Tax=Haematomicrobium sanguinis TaxID=479106 RepID=UPI000AE9F510|nr:MFS transporter [Haematomicrobium sanguinis]
MSTTPPDPAHPVEPGPHEGPRTGILRGQGILRRTGRAILPHNLGPQFGRLWGSAIASNLGDGIMIAAGPLIVAAVTNNNPLLVGLAAAIQRIPWLIFGLFAGVVSDRINRKTIIIAMAAVRVLVLSYLAVTILTGTVNVPILMSVLFLVGTAETFGDTANSAVLPSIVPKSALGTANSRIFGTAMLLNQLAGPVLGGFLFLAGMAFPVGIQALCLVIAIAFIARIRLPGHEPRTAKTGIHHDLKEGIVWIWHHPPVRTLILLITVFNLSFGASFGMLVLYAQEWLGIGEAGYAILLAISAAGGFVGSLIFPALERRFSYAFLLRTGLIIETFMHLILVLTRSPIVAGAILFLFGIHAIVWGSTSATIRQRAVPLKLMGRVSSVHMIGVTGTLAIGQIMGGWFAGIGNITTPYYVAFGLAGLATILVWGQIASVAHAGEISEHPEDEPGKPQPG